MQDSTAARISRALVGALVLPSVLGALAPVARAERMKGPPPRTFKFEGDAKAQRIDDKARRIRLGDGGVANATVEFPAAPEVEGLEPEHWMVRVRVDARVQVGQPTFEAVLNPKKNGPGKPEARYLTTLTSTRGQDTGMALFTLTGDLAAEGGSFRLQLHSKGGEVEVEAIYLERYHGKPTKKMIGKANGHLGPDQIGCGALGFTGLTEHLCTALSVLTVDEHGPAAEAGIERGEIITGVGGIPFGPSSIAPGWDWFESSHEARIGRAIEAALLAGERSIELQVARLPMRPRTVKVALQHPATGADALEGFPLSGPLGDELRADMTRWTASNQRKNGSWPGAPEVTPGLAGLALLGTKDDVHLPAVKQSIDFLMTKFPKPTEMKGLAYWAVAFQGSMFCEYHLRTGDRSVLPWIEEAVAWLPTTTHESKWGMQAFGHGPDGLPYDDKALMAPCAHLLVFDALARHCGVESKIWEHIEPYVRHSWSNPEDGGHGAMGYNASYRDKNEFWSRTGLVALAETLRKRGGDPTEEPLTPYLCVLMEERHPWMLNSHAYGEPGAALGLLSLAVVKPKAFHEILPQWRWRFLCSWEPGYGMRYTTPHMGAPYLGKECVVNLAYLLLLSTSHDGLVMTTVKD